MSVARKSGPGREYSVAVDWRDCAWSPRIVVQSGGWQGRNRRARLLDCGGKRSAMPLLNAAPQVADTDDTHKAVSRPPHSKTAVAFRGFPCGKAFWTVFVRATPVTRRTIF